MEEKPGFLALKNPLPISRREAETGESSTPSDRGLQKLLGDLSTFDLLRVQMEEIVRTRHVADPDVSQLSEPLRTPRSLQLVIKIPSLFGNEVFKETCVP